MAGYQSNPLNEIFERLKQLDDEIRHVENEYEISLLEDKPVEQLRALKSRIQDLKRKRVLFYEAAQQRHFKR